MNGLTAVVVIAGAALAAVLILAYPRLRAAWRPPARLTAAEEHRLRKVVACHALLDNRQRDKLAHLTAQMLIDVRFVGCGGLELTPDMTLVIAAQASQLCLGAQPEHFALPSEVLVYPDAFYIQHDAPDENGLVDDLPTLAAGEAWQQGRVIFSWADIEAALAGADHNVVVHEFAHLLDFAAPGMEGAPPMADFEGWSAAFADAYEQLRADGSPVLDIYGASNPAEFFAVAVEGFFQRGAALQQAHPDLYHVLAAYFDIDTAMLVEKRKRLSN